MSEKRGTGGYMGGLSTELPTNSETGDGEDCPPTVKR